MEIRLVYRKSIFTRHGVNNNASLFLDDNVVVGEKVPRGEYREQEIYARDIPRYFGRKKQKKKTSVNEA